MTEKSLAQQILSATKTLNSRLRRLRAEDLPTAADARMKDIETHRPGFITPSGFVSSTVKGMSEKEMREKLRMIKGLISETETVKEARANLENKMKMWNVSKEEANRRIRAGRVFYQVLGYRGGIFDSDKVHVTIEEFEKTPNYPDLINKLMRDFGYELQNERNGAIVLLEWMNENNEIPPNVEAVKDPRTGAIVYGYYDESGNLIYT